MAKTSGNQRPNAPVRHHDSSGSYYDAPGDPALVIASRLTLQAPFRVDRGLLKRLKRREINASEAFTICDGSGAWFRTSLKECSEDGGMALPYELMNRSPEPAIDITLACAVLARQRMLLVMQKATELGVMRIVPLLTEHSVHPEDLRLEQPHAWPGHVARAAKQCRRSSLPAVVAPMSLDALLISPVCMRNDLRLFLDDRSEVPFAVQQTPRRIILLAGPEGGFSDAEREKLAEKARASRLGGRVLRAETAVIAGLTAVQMAWGDFRDISTAGRLGGG